MQPAIVLFSGGLDSTVLMYDAVMEFGAENVIALSLYYGQKHDKEIEYAEWTCKHLGIQRHIKVDLSDVFKFNPKVCSLLQKSGKDIAEGTYQQQQQESNGTPVATYVPYRNGLFLSYATAVALQLGAKHLMYGAHRDDAVGDAYPDCSENFIEAQGSAIWEGTGKQVILRTPLEYMTKAEVVQHGCDLDMTHEEFEHTWSCYNGKDKPCGVCGTCRDRKKAFEANGIYDIQ